MQCVAGHGCVLPSEEGGRGDVLLPANPWASFEFSSKCTPYLFKIMLAADPESDRGNGSSEMFH